MAAEVKVAVVSFQDTPFGISPYFILSWLPQIIIDSNDNAERIIKYCNCASKSNGNVAGLNCSIDNSVCTWNYLDEKININSLPYTNHYVNNLWYQLIGGLSAATLAHYCFDPCLLLAAGVAKEAEMKIMHQMNWS